MKGRKTGGRVKGTPNKKTQDLLEKAEELGVDPFEILLMVAKGDWEGLGFESAKLVYFTAAGIEAEKDRITLSDRLSAASEACTYLHPKRKAVEHSGPNGGPIETRDLSKLSDDELNARLKMLMDKESPGGLN